MGQKQSFNVCFRNSLGQGRPHDLQSALRHAVENTEATTLASRRSICRTVPVNLIELRAQFRRMPESDERRRLVKQWSHLHRKWVAEKHALALDRLVLNGRRDAGKSRSVPDVLNFVDGPHYVRAEWPVAMARRYETKCNRSHESAAQMQERCVWWKSRGLHERGRGQWLQLGMTILLHALASMLKNKSVGKDGIPTEALKSLDWHSKLLVLQIFENR